MFSLNIKQPLISYNLVRIEATTFGLLKKSSIYCTNRQHDEAYFVALIVGSIREPYHLQKVIYTYL